MVTVDILPHEVRSLMHSLTHYPFVNSPLSATTSSTSMRGLIYWLIDWFNQSDRTNHPRQILDRIVAIIGHDAPVIPLAHANMLCNVSFEIWVTVAYFVIPDNGAHLPSGQFIALWYLRRLARRTARATASSCVRVLRFYANSLKFQSSRDGFWHRNPRNPNVLPVGQTEWDRVL